MLIRIAFGARAGQVVDALPDAAHAMLADGRATLPDAPMPVVTEQVAARVDRDLPRHKRKAVR